MPGRLSSTGTARRILNSLLLYTLSSTGFRLLKPLTTFNLNDIDRLPGLSGLRRQVNSIMDHARPLQDYIVELETLIRLLALTALPQHLVAFWYPVEGSGLVCQMAGEALKTPEAGEVTLDIPQGRAGRTNQRLGITH